MSQIAAALVHQHFIAHLDAEDVGYAQHFVRSMLLAKAFGAAAARAVVHAVIPGVYTEASTAAIKTDFPRLLETIKDLKHG
jgi:hypothetical protein